MKQLLILLASLALFACGGGDAGDTADDAAEIVEEAAETEGEEIADAMHDAMDKAKDVEAILADGKEATDDAIEEAEDAVGD